MEVACWAHVRRKVYEVHVATSSPAARDLLERMTALFKIEADIRGQTADERLAARIQHALPLLDELKVAMETVFARDHLLSQLRILPARQPRRPANL
jgi:transposase